MMYQLYTKLRFTMQSRPPKKLFEWQFRPKTTTPAFKKAAVTATKAAEDICQAEPGEQGVQESSTSPVSAYNEWDPLEVASKHDIKRSRGGGLSLSLL